MTLFAAFSEFEPVPPPPWSVERDLRPLARLLLIHPLPHVNWTAADDSGVESPRTKGGRHKNSSISADLEAGLPVTPSLVFGGTRACGRKRPLLPRQGAQHSRRVRRRVGVDLHARLVERHLARFIPGNPSMIIRNNPGAAASWHSTTCTTASSAIIHDLHTAWSVVFPTKENRG